jgi:putative glycosyltransferase
MLSVVSTLYRSAGHLERFVSRATEAARRMTDAYEIVLVNDGSPDNSLDVALAIQRRDAHIRVVDLSRNFGHHVALMVGLEHARGDLVFLIDSDLEESPEWLEAFAKTLSSSGADVVYGVQDARKGSWFERFSGWLFYELASRRLGVPLPRNVVTARLMTRRYVQALLQFRERELTILALCAIAGYEQQPVVVRKESHGRSTYSLGKRISVLVNAVTSFSNRPLVLIFYLGCVIMIAAMAAAGYLAWRRAIGGVGVPGYASVAVSLWFLGGLMIFCIGVVGIYLAKVFIEVKQRPYAIVRAQYPPAPEDPAWNQTRS